MKNHLVEKTLCKYATDENMYQYCGFLTEKKIETTNMNTRPAQNTAEFKNYFFCTCTEGFLSVVKRFWGRVGIYVCGRNWMKECGQLNLKKVWYLQGNIEERVMIILIHVIRWILSKILNWERPNKCYFRIKHIRRWRRWIIYVKRVSHQPFLFSHRTGNVKSFFSSHSHFSRCHVLDRCPLFWASARTLQRSRILCPPPVDLNAHVNLLLICMRSGTFILICMYMCTHTL